MLTTGTEALHQEHHTQTSQVLRHLALLASGVHIMEQQTLTHLSYKTVVVHFQQVDPTGMALRVSPLQSVIFRGVEH